MYSTYWTSRANALRPGESAIHAAVGTDEGAEVKIVVLFPSIVGVWFCVVWIGNDYCALPYRSVQYSILLSQPKRE